MGTKTPRLSFGKIAIHAEKLEFVFRIIILFQPLIKSSPESNQLPMLFPTAVDVLYRKKSHFFLSTADAQAPIRFHHFQFGFNGSGSGSKLQISSPSFSFFITFPAFPL